MHFPQARAYFASRADPYAGGDLDNAQKIGSVFCGLQVLLIVLLLPLSPPTEAIGEAGWLVAGAVVLGGVAVTYAMRLRRIQSWSALLGISYGAVAALEVMQWLGGGNDAPYERLVLLAVLFVAAIQPPRRIAAFLVFVGLALVAPFLYDGWQAAAAGSSAASLLIWCGLALVANLLMSGVRAQRVMHARDEADARKEARVDALTGLHNRRAFNEILASEVEVARRLRIPLSLAMIDIVRFKHVNDEWGPAEGDRCLREVAEALRSSLRDPDHCFRWGGDEFAVILTGMAAEYARPLADRLRAEVLAACMRPDDRPIDIRFAVTQLEDGETPEELVEMTGLAMTAAKLDASI